MGEGINLHTGSRQRSSARMQNSVDMNSRKFKSAITRASRYTDNNYHGEARRTMAKAFGYNDLADRYSQVIKEHNAAGSLTPSLAERRNSLDDELERRIRKEHGEAGVKALNRGLS